jgi:hypothetical protein
MKSVTSELSLGVIDFALSVFALVSMSMSSSGHFIEPIRQSSLILATSVLNEHGDACAGWLHQGREIIAIVPLENGAFCTIFSENFHKF